MGLPLEVNSKLYLIRRDDIPWPEIKETKKPKQRKVIVNLNKDVNIDEIELLLN
jgi:hypothetical protein